MAVRIRLKRMGRAHRPFYRVCAIDRHSPRDGRVLEELGTYDTSIADTDARTVLKKDRIDYWLGVGAQPSDRCAVLIKKYGTDGTHTENQQQALLKLAAPKQVPAPGTPASLPKKVEEAKAKTEDTGTGDTGTGDTGTKDAKTEEAAAKDAKPAAGDAKPSTGAKEAEPVAKAKEPVAKAEETATKDAEPEAKASEESKS